jgi:diacylglycerol kinase (ATP)
MSPIRRQFAGLSPRFLRQCPPRPQSIRLRAIKRAPISATSVRRRAFVVFNPAAGRRRRSRLAATLQHLVAAGCTVELRTTAARGDAERLIREAAARENAKAVDLFVVAGGDGTINEAVNGLLSTIGAAPPLAIMPLGTINAVAREIGLPTAPAEIAEVIANGVVRIIHVGRANGRCFTVMVCAGFDAHVMAGVSVALKRWLGTGAYALEALRQLFRFKFRRYRVTIDGRTYDAASAIVAKGHFYGLYVCAPEARLDAPEFQVCLLDRGGRWSTIRYGLALVCGRLPRLSECRIVCGRSIVIEGPVGDPVQGDGEIIARLPVRIELVPQPLSLIVPNTVLPSSRRDSSERCSPTYDAERFSVAPQHQPYDRRYIFRSAPGAVARR